jgi:hypothetical protein
LVVWLQFIFSLPLIKRPQRAVSSLFQSAPVPPWDDDEEDGHDAGDGDEEDQVGGQNNPG